MRETPHQAGGGRHRAALVEKAHETIRSRSQSFAVAASLFDRDTRERAWLLYAWCRRCDDIADNQGLDRHPGPGINPLKDAEDRLQAIRVLTRRAFDEQPTADPAFDGFGLVADECGLDPELANDVIAGFALEAVDWHPRTQRDMLRFCYHVAGSVGVMMARVMGVGDVDGETLDRACDLGIAIELAKIARDVVDDAADDRCYLPVEWLAEMDIAPGEHAKPHNRAALAALMPRLVALMDRHAAAARLGTKRLPFRQRWAVLAAARIYGAIGHKVLALGPAAWNERVASGKGETLRHVVRAFGEALVNRPRPATEPVDWTRHDFRPVAGW